MSIDNIFFDVATLKAEFNKKVNLLNLYDYIQRKYTLNEITKYALVCYYKKKRNVVLISLTNEKIFIHSNANLNINGIYSYQDIKGFNFIENTKNNILIVKTSEINFELKHISKQVYNEMFDIYEQEKTIFVNSKIGQNIIQSFSNFNSLNFVKMDEFSKKEEEKRNISNNNNEENDDKNVNKKAKRVINDENISLTTTLSSSYILELLTDPKKPFPNNKNSVIKNIDERLLDLENTNLFNKPFDSVALKFTSNSKLNTIPVLVEFSSLNNKDKTENRLLFSRNWIEFTKHNVKNKLLGVDENGNGSYIDINNANKSQVIKSYKAKEYIFNGQSRYGLRSSQKVDYKDRDDKIGLESMYVDPLTNDKLDMSKFDGIIFMNKKYYFDIPSEFDVLQRKKCIVSDIRVDKYRKIILHNLIFEDNTLSYMAYDQEKNLIDDSYNGSSMYDLKWLTFFKD